MIVVIVVGWIGTVAVLCSYFAVKRRGIRQFHWTNAFCGPLVAFPALVAGVWSAAAISLAFGAIGIYNLIKERKR